MRGYLGKGFSRGSTIQDPFYKPVKVGANPTLVAADAQAEADAARELGQGQASQALQDQADALREDLESKGEDVEATEAYEDALDHDGE